MLNVKAAVGGVLKIFPKFTGNHLCWSLFLTKLQVSGLHLSPIQVFSYEFWDIFKKTFFAEHLRATASINPVNFSQSFFESENSVFVYTMLEKRNDWRRDFLSLRLNLKNRAF